MDAKRGTVTVNDGDRLYALLALFDTRDGTWLSDLVAAAREGYEHANMEHDGTDPWENFDRLWATMSEERRIVGIVHVDEVEAPTSINITLYNDGSKPLPWKATPETPEHVHRDVHAVRSTTRQRAIEKLCAAIGEYMEDKGAYEVYCNAKLEDRGVDVRIRT